MNYKNTALQKILNNNNSLFDEDIMSLLKKPPLESMDVILSKALKIAKEKAKDVKAKAEELVDLAVEKGTPVLKKTANDVLNSVIKVSKETQKKLSKEK